MRRRPFHLPFLLAAALAAAGASTLAAQTGPRSYEIDTGASVVYAIAHRSGLFGFLGHEHAILAERWSAQLCYDPERPDASAARITVDATALVIDTDSARRVAEMGDGPGEEDRREIQAKLTSERFLGVQQYPEIVFRTTRVTGEQDGTLQVQGELTMRDSTRTYDVPVKLERDDDGTLHLDATLDFRLSHFGIRRERVAGVVNVADEADLHARLVARPTAEACEIDRGR